jgi:hypothetical protein
MSTYQWSKSLIDIAKEFNVDLKTFKKMLATHEICLPDGIVFAPYQKWIYEWIAYPPEVRKEDYQNEELPKVWMEKCAKFYKE